MGERVVVIGQGAREHALAHKLAYGFSHSERMVRDVVVLGGNAGLAREFECYSLKTNDLNEIVDHCTKLTPDLIVIGPENYLAQGLKNRLAAQGFTTFGPTEDAAQLEASKYFAKKICQDAKITTAHGDRFDSFLCAENFVERHHQPRMVIKVDGLCAGKGVSVCQTKEEAMSVVRDLFCNNGFARLGVNEPCVVIEEFLAGSEVSVFGLAHGTNVQLFCPMQDYKRLNDGDHGPNTGGMGAIGPLGSDVLEREQFLGRIKESIFLPALTAMAKRQQPFSGLLYAGLMLVANTPYLLEFNVRFGDPETQALLFGTHVDIFPLLQEKARGIPSDGDYWQKELLQMAPTVSIVLASEDYPFKKSTTEPLLALPKEKNQNAQLFFAACRNDDKGRLLAASGRVLNVVARGAAVAGAQALGYEIVRKIDFAGMHYRRDIGTHITELRYER